MGLVSSYLFMVSSFTYGTFLINAIVTNGLKQELVAYTDKKVRNLK